MKSNVFNFERNISTAMLLGVFLVTGCDTKSVETAPQTVGTSEGELSVDDRLKIQDQVDAKLEQVDSASRKVLKVVNHVRKLSVKILNRGNPDGDYTPLDFLLDLNDAFKGKLPKNVRNVNEANTRYSKIKLPANLVTDGCSEMEARLDSYMNGQSEIISLNYSLSSCKDPENFIVIASASWDKDFHWDFNKDGLKKVFTGVFDKSLGDELGCTAKVDKFGSDVKVVSVNCPHLNFHVGSDVEFKVNDLSYAEYGTKEVSAFARVIESGKLKAYMSLTGTSDGTINMDINRPEDMPEGWTPPGEEQPVLAPSDSF